MKKTKIVFGFLVMALSANIALAQFKPTVFQPQTYQPQTTDYSTLERSFQIQENRSNMAYQKYSELAQLIREKRQRISNDRETLEWFSNNIDTRLKDVKEWLSVGDYQGAIERATKAIGDINSNTELIRRIQTYEEYQNIVRYIQERTDLSYQQKQEWMELYKYKFVPILNAEGKVIGAYDWKEIGGPNNTRVVLP
jgi:tetratricopeptide (TPR) repeat protein